MKQDAVRDVENLYVRPEFLEEENSGNNPARSEPDRIPKHLRNVPEEYLLKDNLLLLLKDV
jgi:hypothetical protein